MARLMPHDIDILAEELRAFLSKAPCFRLLVDRSTLKFERVDWPNKRASTVIITFDVTPGEGI